MIGKKTESAINDQINEEMYSSYLYLSMAAHFEAEKLPGFANWMRVQAKEENFHAMKFFDYLLERGGRVHLKPIGGPDAAWKTPLAAFEAAYKHEIHITQRINKVMDVAEAEKDRSAANLLQWYIDEQVEEERNAETLVHKLKMIGDSKGSLYMLDKELSKRTFNPPAASEE
jgi:ferritin